MTKKEKWEPSKVCVVHGKPMNEFSFCDNFAYCEDGLVDERAYVCHEVGDCVEECVHTHEAADSE